MEENQSKEQQAAQLLQKINQESAKVEYRLLKAADLTEGYFNLLSQLTKAPYPEDKERIQAQFKFVNTNPDYFILLAVERETHNVLGTASLVIERKFIRDLASTGHIEDVVVSKEARGLGVGKGLITALGALAEGRGCYKIILDCSEANQGFYEKCGYQKKGIQMGQYFNE